MPFHQNSLSNHICRNFPLILFIKILYLTSFVENFPNSFHQITCSMSLLMKFHHFLSLFEKRFLNYCAYRYKIIDVLYSVALVYTIGSTLCIINYVLSVISDKSIFKFFLIFHSKTQSFRQVLLLGMIPRY